MIKQLPAQMFTLLLALSLLGSMSHATTERTFVYCQYTKNYMFEIRGGGHVWEYNSENSKLHRTNSRTNEILNREKFTWKMVGNEIHIHKYGFFGGIKEKPFVTASTIKHEGKCHYRKDLAPEKIGIVVRYEDTIARFFGFDKGKSLPEKRLPITIGFNAVDYAVSVDLDVFGDFEQIESYSIDGLVTLSNKRGKKIEVRNGNKPAHLFTYESDLIRIDILGGGYFALISVRR